MADEESQVQEDTSWWAFDGFADSDLPSMSIDEPLEWPDSLPWEEYSTTSAPVDSHLAPPGAPADLVFPADPGPEPVAAPDDEWRPDGYDTDATVAATPLAGLGGGAAMPAAAPAPADDGIAVQPLPESIWSFDGGDDDHDQMAGLATLAAPLAYADNDGRGRGGWLRQLDIKRGNVAVVALISAVSLVLLGMFLSVRSRNDLPTDATASPPRTDQIATANTRNPQPSTSVATTTTVAGPVINIADLLPQDAAAAAGAGAGAGTVGGGGSTAVNTTAPARSTAAPAGNSGGGSTATTQPAPQSTATTAAPEPPPDTTPDTSPPPPVDDTPSTTRPRTTQPSFTVPTFPDVTVPSPGTSIPDGFFFPAPGFPRNND